MFILTKFKKNSAFLIEKECVFVYKNGHFLKKVNESIDFKIINIQNCINENIQS
jgi:hypothetical protein